MIPTNRFRLGFFALLALLITTGGCRSYGDYGSEAGTIEQVQQANQDFATALDRARNDLDLLQNAAQSNAALQELVPAYKQVIAMHEEKLAAHRALAERLGEDADYRSLSRVFGAIISEHRLVDIRYQELHHRIQRTSAGAVAVTGESLSESRYYVTPIFYERVENGNRRLTMKQALQGTQ